MGLWVFAPIWGRGPGGSSGPPAPAPLTVGRHCTAPQRSEHPVHWLLRRRAAPAPQGNHALRGSCCGRWTRSRPAGTRCQPHKGACRSLWRWGRSDHDLFLEPIPLHAPLPLLALWSLETSCWGPGSSPYLLCRQAPASWGPSALEEPRWWPQATPWSIGGEGESPEPGVYLGLRLASGAQRGVT